MHRKTILFDANRFSTLASFYQEVENTCTKDLGWPIGRNLDAFNDVLWGGFRVYDYEEPIRLIWLNSDKSRTDLGWAETVNYLTTKLTTGPASTAVSAKRGLALAESRTGKTLFEIIVDIIQEHGTTAACFSSLSLGKQWLLKQRDFLRAQQEKITAELQLLKAQVHPHFLFNTLNNIYSFSLDRSPKTPELILKLSSLLSYMLYDCKAEQVKLEKEVEIMKDYIDLEKERYGNTLEISWTVEGAIRDNFISPLLMLPFLENAFKHGASEQIEKPWLGVDISVENNILKFKITNSKNEYISQSNNGIGINNVKKRLEFLYPGKYELKINDEGDFFAVSLIVKLSGSISAYTMLHLPPVTAQTITS